MFRLDHVVVPVADAAATYNFYTEILGLPLIDALSGDNWNGKPWLMMLFDAGEGRELVFTVIPGLKLEKLDPPDIRHYAFAVDDKKEQDAWRKKLRAKGVNFWEEDHGPQQSIYFKDPSGVVLEITAPPSGKVAEVNPKAAALIKKWVADQS